MKTIVIYKTIYGSSKECANWLAKELKCKSAEADSISNLGSYDQIIALSGVYAGRMPVINSLKKQWTEIKNKKLVIIALGLLLPNHLWSKISYYLIPSKIRKASMYYKIKGRDPEDKKIMNKEELKKVIKQIN